MKRLLSILFLLVFLATNNYCFIASPAAISLKPDGVSKKAKKKGKKNKKSSVASTVVFGSILNANNNVVKTKKLPKKVLRQIKKQGVDKLSVRLTLIAEEGDSTSIYTLGSDGIELKKNKLILNLFANLLNSSGATVTAGALPDGQYKLSLVIGEEVTDIKDTLTYNRPVVVTGTVEGCNGGGTEQINDLSGELVSKVVALTSECVYINEVTADRISSSSSSSRTIRNQTSPDGGTPPEDGTDNQDPQNFGISECTTGDGKKLKAPVEFDPEKNGEQQVDHNDQTTYEVDNIVNLAPDPNKLQEIFNDEFVPGEDGVISAATEFLSPDQCAPLLQETVIQNCDLNLIDVAQSSDGFFDVFTELTKEPVENLVTCGRNLVSVLEGIIDVGDLPDGRTIRNQVDQTPTLRSCIPGFVFDEVIPNVQTDDDFADFARKFIINADDQENRDRVDANFVCEDLKFILEDLRREKKRFGAAFIPPCLPKDLIDIGLEECPDVASKLISDNCENPHEPCQIDGQGPNIGPSGEDVFDDNGNGFKVSLQTACPVEAPILCTDGRCVKEVFECFDEPGTSTEPIFEGGDGCIEHRDPGEDSLCQPCESDLDCINPVRVTIPPVSGLHDGCVLPKAVCKDDVDPFTGTTLGMICLLEANPRDPFTCQEFDEFQCFDAFIPIQPGQCDIGRDGFPSPGFNINCCLEFNATPIPIAGVPQRSIKLQTTTPLCTDDICDDGNPNTSDVCDPERGCIHQFLDTTDTTGGDGSTTGGTTDGGFPPIDEPRPFEEFGGIGPCVFEKLCSTKSHFDENGNPKETFLDQLIRDCKEEFGKKPGGDGGFGLCSCTGDLTIDPPECQDLPQICPEVFDPVCGCNGVTYSNRCEALASGILQSKDGTCEDGGDEHPPECDDLTFAEQNPDICGEGGPKDDCFDPVFAEQHPDICGDGGQKDDCSDPNFAQAHPEICGDGTNQDPICGNGIVEHPEQCDDGNTLNGDGCTADCTNEFTDAICGDGKVDPPEQCDDGNTGNGDGCSADCKKEDNGGGTNLCGNGTKDASEECDDGNTNNGDGCTADCTVECLDPTPFKCQNTLTCAADAASCP